MTLALDAPDGEQAIIQWLKIHTDMRRKCGPPRSRETQRELDRMRWWCPEELVLTEGWNQNEMLTDPEVIKRLPKRGVMKACYKNALEAFVCFTRKPRAPGKAGKAAYIEGWACPDTGIPVHHAWLRVETPEGWRTWDPTWDPEQYPSVFYRGVSFDFDMVRSKLHEDGGLWGSMMFDARTQGECFHLPLLQGRVQFNNIGG